MLHSKHDMLVDVQDMRCVLAVCFTHFCPGRRACLLPLDLDIMPRCGFVRQTWVEHFQHVDEPPAFPLYI